MPGEQASVGGVLSLRRVAAGMTQAELAHESGLSVRAISDLERDKVGRPRRRSLELLAAALRLDREQTAALIAISRGVPVRWLVTGGAEAGAAPDRTRVQVLVPRQLPGKTGSFVGRGAELATLSGWLENAANAGGTVVISAIGGTAGVGKTALAVQWAHQVADRFPDGQLHVNLRGYDPDQPVPATDALAGFLRALGMPREQIPAEAEERAAAYRSLLARRRMLIVLDNARTADQVRPLLPGDSSCAVVVTSRDALAGLVARDGAARLELDLLPAEEAAGLLRELIGERAAADPDATAQLAACCARLPLALRVAAELASARPAVSLAALAGELAGQQGRLDLLEAGGDSHTAVRAVFSWSYQHLDHAAARAFRLVSLHPGPDFESYAAAALTGSTVEQAGRLLGQLARAHLIQPAAPGRHGVHDLLRGYARELAGTQDGDHKQREALTGLFDHYLYSAAAATSALFPADTGSRPAIPVPASPVPPVSDATAARAWLDAERASLVAVAAHAAAHGWPSHATRLSAHAYRYLDAAGHVPEAINIHACALRAARETGDRAAEAAALIGLGVVAVRQDRYRQALGHLQQALALCREIGDRSGAARALNNLGMVDLQRGRYREATGHLQQGLALFRELGDFIGEARALQLLGSIDFRQCRYREAAWHYEQALELCRETGDRTGEAAP